MGYYTHSFEIQVARHLVGKGDKRVPYTVVWMPDELKRPLNMVSNPRLRVQGELNDLPFEAAWQPAGENRFFLMIPKSILREASLSLGDMVELRFNVADQTWVDVPESLLAILGQDAELQSKWDDLTSGKQRSFAYRVASAKLESTIQKRIDEVTRMIREGLSYTKGGAIK